MNAFVVTNLEDDKAITLIKNVGVSNIGISSSHADAIKSCSTSMSKRCLISDGGIDIGHQSISHVINEVATMSDTTELVVFGAKTYVLTKDLAQSWINEEKVLNLEKVHEKCSNMPCQQYEFSEMKNCKGYGLFQDCS